MTKTAGLNEIEDLSKLISDNMDVLFESSEFMKFLNSVSKHFINGHSYKNTMLIHLQRPDSEHVRGYDEWQDFGRQVKANSTGIKLFAPSIVTDYGEKGSFCNHVLNILKNDLTNNPNKDVAFYILGKSGIVFNLNRDGVFKIAIKDKVLNFTEKEFRQFVETRIVNKVPYGYKASAVFDIKDTTIPETLFVSNNYLESEIQYLNGNPIRNARNQIQILNSDERVKKFKEIPILNDEQKNVLKSALSRMSGHDSEQLSEHIESIVSSKFEKLNPAINHTETIKAISYICAKRYGIDYPLDLESIDEFSPEQLKSFQTEFFNVLKESKKLVSEIEKSLSEIGYNRYLEPNEITRDQLDSLAKEVSDYVLTKNREHNSIIKEMSTVNRNNLSEEQKLCFDEQVILAKESLSSIQQVKNYLDELEVYTIPEDLSKITNTKQHIEKLKQIIAENKVRFNDLTEQLITLNIKNKSDLSFQFKNDSRSVLEEIKGHYNLDDIRISYVEKSPYIKQKLSKLLNSDVKAFIDATTKITEDIGRVASKNDSFIEVLSCDEPQILEPGLYNPKLFDKRIQQANNEIGKLKEDAQREDSYYPYSKATVTFFTPHENSYIALKTTIRMGTGVGDFKSHLDSISKIASDDRTTAIQEAWDKALNDRVYKGKFIPFANQNHKSLDLDEWERRIEVTKSMDEHEQGKDQTREKASDFSVKRGGKDVYK